MTRELKYIKADAQQANSEVERVGVANPEGSDLHTLAFSVHALAVCVRDLSDHVEALQRPR
jgi:hypothetical protein